MALDENKKRGSSESRESRVVFAEDLETGTENSDSRDDEPISNEFSTVGPLPSEIIASPPCLRRYSDNSGTNSSIACGNVDIHGTSMMKKIPNYDRSVSKGALSTTSKGAKTRSTHSSGSSSGGSRFHSPSMKATPRHVFYGRWLFFILLCMVASFLGFLTHYLLTSNETYLAECVFTKVSNHAIRAIRGNQMKKKLGMDSMGSVIGSTGSELEQWPFVAQNDYETIANNIIDTSNGCYIAFGPILTPMQVPEFEAYAEDFYQNTRKPEPFPNGTAVKFHKGVSVWAMDGEMPYHDISGETSWESKRRIVVPMYQHAAGPSKKLMFNLHSSPLLGQMIEEMMTCAEETKELIVEYNEIIREGIEDSEEPPSMPSLQDCTIVTDIGMNRTSWVQGLPKGPGANMLQPIFPANDKTEMVGVLVTAINWHEILYDVFSENVDGIDVILSTPSQKVTYRINKGIPEYQGPGDLHDPNYDFIKSIAGEVTPFEYFANQSVPYTISFHARESLFELYSTKNPYYATVGAICIMVFTVLMFLAYDFLVRREFNAKNELLKAKRHFMRYVSHEVRTPLNSVCMGLNLMQEEIQAKLAGPHNDDSQDAMITIDEAQAWLSLSRDVHISAQSATNVLNDFLNYDKIESRQLTLELSIIPIQALINGTVSEFVLPAQDKSINMSVLREKLTSNSNPVLQKKQNSKKSVSVKINEMESQLLEDQVVVGDKARLSQVVRNVISNAIKFTPEKGQITVKTTWMVATVGESTNVNLQDGTTEALNQTGWIQLEVTDTGPGMTEDQLATVFQSGVQFNANKNQKGGGSGLGLFIAEGIVNQHNGTLTVDSEGLGKGSSFVCKLPVYCEPKRQTADHLSIDSRDASITERVSSSWLDEHTESDLCYRILVVDDAPMNRKLLTRLLLKRGHEVDMAEDGLQAHDMVVAEMKEGRRYDTILMDFQMPIMDGPTATQKIRSIGCDSFIVGITGNVLPQDVEHFKMCGADGVLGKPFQVEELESMWIEYGVTSE